MESHRLPVTGNTEKTAPENRAFYPALDGLRAIAFLMVCFQHYASLPWGWTGVDLFFVLSGFLITGILFDTRNDRYRVRNFYIRRTLRIFPLYYGVMLFLCLLYPFVHWEWSWKWLIWPAYLGNYARFVHPYQLATPAQRLVDFQPVGHFGRHSVGFYLGHFWSLCVEEQFYLVWPWVVFWVRDRRKLLWVCAVSLPLCLAMRIAGQHLLPTWMLDAEVLNRVTVLRLDALLWGGFLALMLRGAHHQLMQKIARIALPVAIAIILVWLALTPAGHLWQRVGYPYPVWRFTWGLTAIDVFFGLVLLAALRPGSIVYRIFNFYPLRWLGRISYGLYVFHDIPHGNYWNFAVRYLRPWASVFVALPCTILLAWLSFTFFEAPFLNLKERWTRHS